MVLELKSLHAPKVDRKLSNTAGAQMAELSDISFSRLANALTSTVITARRSDEAITGVLLRYGRGTKNADLKCEGKRGV
jgi:hypothetical protein